MTQQLCTAHLHGSNHMAKITKNPMNSDYHSVPDDTDAKQYIKTFDAADDPIVYVLVRTSPYTFDDVLIGVFDSKEALMVRLNRIMDRPENDETFKIETHNLRNLQQEKDLDR